MTDVELVELLRKTKTIAIVGLSNNPDRPSFEVASYLLSQGFTIIPINPKCVSILGQKCFSDLITAVHDLVPTQIDIVDIFRRSEFVLAHVAEAITIKPLMIWMQEGVEHQAAAQKVQQAGIPVVMNKCLMKEHKRITYNLNLKTSREAGSGFARQNTS
jgi:predicted CoA-binding protein